MIPAAWRQRLAGKGPVILNFVLFQLAWLACIQAAAAGRPLLGTLAVVAVAAWHLHQARRPLPELRLMLWAVLIGLALDSLVLSLGVLRYHAGQYAAALPPHWMSAMWALLATTLNVSMGWLRGRPVLSAALGAVSGPLSYAAGVRLGAASFIDAPWALGVLAVGWALAMPLLMRLAQRHDGITPLAASSAPAASAAPPRPAR